MSSVVNVRVQYIRPKHANLAEWINDDLSSNLYIGRGGVVFINKQRYPPSSSKWCNPYKIGRDGNRDQILAKYETFICQKLKTNEYNLAELHGKTLGCWCHPLPCHGDILCKLIDNSCNK